jgi:hypothetical protein
MITPSSVLTVGKGGHWLIQFDGLGLRFLAVENGARDLLDGCGVSDDTDLAGRHRTLLDFDTLLRSRPWRKGISSRS